MKSLIIFSLFICQVAFAQQDVGQRTSALSKARADIEAVVDRRNFSDEDHRVIKEYFSSLNSFESDISQYPKYRRRLNTSVRSTGVESFCGSVLLDVARYNSLVSNCTKNGFFLCTDDVMTLVETKKKLSENLDTDLKTEFDKIDKCK